MEKLKELFRKMNEAGVPLPMLRDPVTGKASVTLTMMVLSFNTALLGQIGKLTNFLGDVDMTSAMSLFVATSALYLGRKLQNNGKENIVESPNKEEGKSE
jgi:hypothetical protein